MLRCWRIISPHPRLPTLAGNRFPARGTIMKNLTLSPFGLRTIRIISAVAVLAVLVSAGLAQNREKFGISAKAGGVNSVTGNVMVTSAGQPAKALTDQDD